MVLVVDLLGDVILDEYGVSSAIWIAPVAAVALFRSRRLRGNEPPVSYSWLLVATGYFGGIAGVRDLLDDVESSGYLEGLIIVFALALHAAAALIALGAYRLSKKR